MGSHLATCLVAIGALVHRLVKCMCKVKGHEATLQAHLDDVASLWEDLEEKLKGLCYSLDKVVA